MIASTPDTAAMARKLLKKAKEREARMTGRLAELVNTESPSDDRAAVNRAVELVAQWATALGGRVRLHHHAKYGDSLEARFAPARLAPRRSRRGANQAAVMLLGHLDTVWEMGTLRHMPWRATRERIYGPGVMDMKAGVVMMFEALTLLLDSEGDESGSLTRPVVVLLHGDEEIGSPASRALTETLARKSSAVYVLEPAQGEAGAYKTARKGVGQYRIKVEGVAAHSGVDFTRGASAILELSQQIESIRRITDLPRGITVNPGLIGGGTRVNVIAAEAWVEVDVRIGRRRDQLRVDRAMRRLRPHNKACRLEITGGLNRPPMERTPATAALFEQARGRAAEMGLSLVEASTGGGSDGNFTSALGVPTLDGMGAVGAGAHAPDEHLLRRHLAPRTALLASMLL